MWVTPACARATARRPAVEISDAMQIWLVALGLVLPGALRAPARASLQPMMAARKVLASLSFAEARAMARALGLDSRDEFLEYACPGAYRLPSDPDVVWAADWQGWDDFLGTRLPWEEARSLVRALGLKDDAAYTAMRAEAAAAERADPNAWNGKHALRLRSGSSDGPEPLGRLPAKPDLVYREWTSWTDFLGADE